MTSIAPRLRRAGPPCCVLAAAALALSSCGGGASPAPTPPVPVQPSPPGVPQNLRVTDRGENFVEWQWDAVPGAAGYQVQVSIGDDSFNPPDEEAALAANQTAVRFEDDRLTPGTTVYLRVRAFSGSQSAPTYGSFSGGVSGMTAGAAPPPGDDRGRLAALYAATGGEDWKEDENWLSDRPIDEWYGVETDGEGRVVSLDLEDNALEGEIPAVLGGLNRLRAVDLGGNRLRGVIPPELGRLTAVQTVDLSENALTGGIPPDLAEWSQLGDLDLSDNALTGEIPSRLGSGGTVRRLDLGNNRLTGEIPPDLAEWSQLEELDLGDNALDGEIPQAFGRLSPIRSVDLSGNRLSGRIPELSGEWLDYLEHLDLGHNEISGEIPATIGRARRLTGLDLGSNRLTGRIPPELGNLSELMELDLGNEEDLLPAGIGQRAAQTAGPGDGNALTGPIPPELGRLRGLERLNLSGNDLTGTVPRELANLALLVILNLANNAGLIGDLPEEFTALASLEVLLLQGTSVTIPDTPGFQIWLVQIPTVGLPGSPSGDRAALEALYRATDGPNWTNNAGWLTDAPLGDWYGITTDSDGRVTELSLGSNGLEGTIPPALGDLTSLTELLTLSRNRLSGPIPPELGQLTNLELLSLHSNELSGPIPPELAELMELTNLYLYGNALSGPIPPELGDLANLTWLFLDENRLSGPIPPALGQLAKLTRLGLSENQLSGPVPAELGNLTALDHLRLHGNPLLSGPLPDPFVALTALTELTLQDTGVCVPTGTAFDAWVNGIRGFEGSRCTGLALTASILPPDPSEDSNCGGWLFCPDGGTNETSAMASINPAATVQVSAPATIAPEWIAGAAAVAVPAGAPTAVFASVRWDALQRDVVRDGATFRIEPTGSGETMFVTCGPFECSEAAASPPAPPDLASPTAATCSAWDPTLELEVGWIENWPTYEEQRGLDVGWRYTAGLDFSVEHSFQGVPNGVNLTRAGPDGEAASRPTPLSMRDATGQEFGADHYDPALAFICQEASSYPAGLEPPEECFRAQMAGGALDAANYLSGYSVSLAPLGSAVIWGRIQWEEFAGLSCPTRTFAASDRLDVCELLDAEVALVLDEAIEVMPWLTEGGTGAADLDRSYVVWQSESEIEGRRFATLFVDVNGDGAFDSEETRFDFGFTETSIRGPAFLDDDGDPLSDIGKIDLEENPDTPPDGVADNDGGGAWSEAERQCSRDDGGSGADLCDAEQTFTVTPTFAGLVGFGCRTTATIEVTCTWDAQGGLRGAVPDAQDVAHGEVSIDDFLRCDAEVQE